MSDRESDHIGAFAAIAMSAGVNWTNLLSETSISSLGSYQDIYERLAEMALLAVDIADVAQRYEVNYTGIFDYEVLEEYGVFFEQALIKDGEWQEAKHEEQLGKLAAYFFAKAEPLEARTKLLRKIHLITGYQHAG